MSENNLKRRLTPMDAFFLYAETEAAPMSVGATLIFEGRLPIVKFKEHIASRLHLVPRYRQRVVPAPFNISNPTWEDDPDFDIDNHIFRVKLNKPGTEQQLQQLKGQIFTGMLDRGKPLWEMYVVESLSEKRSAVILKVHHAMVDGVAGISLAYLFLDVTPEIPKKAQKPRFKPAPLPDMKARLQDALWDNMVDNVVHWLRFGNNIKEFAIQFGFDELKCAVKKFAMTIGGFLMPLKRLPFNGPFSGKRLQVWREYAYSDARAIRAMCGGTLNDVVLTVLAAAMRKYVEEHADDDLGKYQSLRVLVPVNVRRERERAALGNRISFLPVEIPFGVEDPIELLHAVHERMRELKDAHVADSVSLMFDALQGSPVPLQSMLLSAVANPVAQRLLGQIVEVPPANLICTNVPGPQIPLYAFGHRMLAMYGVVPTCLGMGVNCAVVSYDQKLFVSFVGDAQAGGDAVAEIMECFDQKFKELRDATDVKGAKYIEITRVVEHETSLRKEIHREGEPHNGRHRGTVPEAVTPETPLWESIMVEAAGPEMVQEASFGAPLQESLEREPATVEGSERDGFQRNPPYNGKGRIRQEQMVANVLSWSPSPSASARKEDAAQSELTATR
jgi:WS/DGAT/MGAT family acyltransferase